jgi:hypothetical protein
VKSAHVSNKPVGNEPEKARIKQCESVLIGSINALIGGNIEYNSRLNFSILLETATPHIAKSEKDIMQLAAGEEGALRMDLLQEAGSTLGAYQDALDGGGGIASAKLADCLQNLERTFETESCALATAMSIVQTSVLPIYAEIGEMRDLPDKVIQGTTSLAEAGKITQSYSELLENRSPWLKSSTREQALAFRASLIAGIGIRMDVHQAAMKWSSGPDAESSMP